jgi:serine phosphatase RsbU (regulator of sigma subunit)/anti-sigma regulatory factor (Ser/Thr protein kinase)
MMTENISFWDRLFRRKPGAQDPDSQTTPQQKTRSEIRKLDLPPNDPLLAYVLSSPGVIEVDKLKLDSPTLASLRANGIQLTLPLVSQGELIGLLNLGPRLSEQEYSSDDFRLLNNLGTQASPALRVAQLALEQLAEAQERERIEQELRVARVIQETLLPKEIPEIEGWRLEALWQPAREVGGDFYDFIMLPDGRIGVIVADVTDKGVPAAMVMATTRSLLRAAAERILEPGKVLARANELLHPDIPARMFVTCLYIVFDPHTGHVVFANAGHNLPYLRTKSGVQEMRARGMPLGLMPGMEYEEKEFSIQAGEKVLLSSDGLVEAHNEQREMFSFPKVQEIMAEEPADSDLIGRLMSSLADFTGADYEQEDDITLVTLARLSEKHMQPHLAEEFEVESREGNERGAAARVLEITRPLQLPESRQKRIETAVAEATMNAMEHGNQYDPEKPVRISVDFVSDKLVITIQDHGGSGTPIPEKTDPDLDAKLSGEQSPRGWGLFLIKNMVDEMEIIQNEDNHQVLLTFILNSQAE